MFAQNKDAIYQSKNRFIWFALAFQGGFVNMLGLLSVHRFVSHVTGFAGHFSEALANLRWFDALGSFFITVFFLLGAIMSGLFTEVRREKGKAPIYIYSMISMSGIFLWLTILGHFKLFGNFGEPFQNFRDFILLASLSFACGMQNALFTQASGAVVRTTHLTGITTDLGIGLAKFITGEASELDLKANRLRMGLIIYFLVGSLIGTLLINRMEYDSFLIPTILSLVIAYRLFSVRKELESQSD
ncbi:MAG: YoaK family protein [Bdellovibrio sp.]